MRFRTRTTEKRLPRVALALATLGLAATGGTAAIADAGSTQLRGIPWGCCLDGDNRQGANVHANSCNDGAYQRWPLHDDGYEPQYDSYRGTFPIPNDAQAVYGAYQLISGGTWKCLGDYSGVLYTAQCDANSDWQAWGEIVWNNGAHSFVNYAIRRVLQITSDGKVSTTPYPGYGHVKEWDFKRGF